METRGRSSGLYSAAQPRQIAWPADNPKRDKGVPRTRIVLRVPAGWKGALLGVFSKQKPTARPGREDTQIYPEKGPFEEMTKTAQLTDEVRELKAQIARARRVLKPQTPARVGGTGRTPGMQRGQPHPRDPHAHS